MTDPTLVHGGRPVALVTRDYLLEKRLAEAFDLANFYTFRSPHHIDHLLKIRPLGFLILDEELFFHEMPSHVEAIMKTYHEAVSENPKIVTIFLYRGSGQLKDLIKIKSDICLFLMRDKVSAQEIKFIEALFGRQEYRTVYVYDLKANIKVDAPLYHYSSSLQKLVSIYNPGTPFDHNALEKLKERQITKLYIRSSDLVNLVENSQSTDLKLSGEMHLLRNKCRQLLTLFFDQKRYGKINEGKEILEHFHIIFRDLQSIFKRLRNPWTALYHLPFERATVLASSINSMIWFMGLALIFKLDEKEQRDGCQAALLSLLGHSKTAHAPFFEDELKSVSEKVEFQHYPVASHSLIEEMKLPISDREKFLILHHAENYDGSGFPHGIEGSKFDKTLSLLQIATYISRQSSWRGMPLAKIIEHLLLATHNTFGGHRFNPITLNELEQKLKEFTA